jgi:hypothetical protein
MTGDSIDRLKADLLTEPEVRAHLAAELDEEVQRFLLDVVRVARRLSQMDNVWEARRILADWAIAVTDLKERTGRELAVKSRPKPTLEGFKR